VDGPLAVALERMALRYRRAAENLDAAAASAACVEPRLAIWSVNAACDLPIAAGDEPESEYYHSLAGVLRGLMRQLAASVEGVEPCEYVSSDCYSTDAECACDLPEYRSMVEWAERRARAVAAVAEEERRERRAFFDLPGGVDG
jgi:hypothetical protein